MGSDLYMAEAESQGRRLGRLQDDIKRVLDARPTRSPELPEWARVLLELALDDSRFTP